MIWLVLSVWKHYPSQRCSFKYVSNRRRCSCFVNAANVWKSLVEHATVPKMRSTRDAFSEICRILTEHLFGRTHLVDCFRNRRFFSMCFCKFLEKHLRTLMLVAKMVFYFLTSILIS